MSIQEAILERPPNSPEVLLKAITSLTLYVLSLILIIQSNAIFSYYRLFATGNNGFQSCPATSHQNTKGLLFGIFLQVKK